eukprot:jgi/Mesvir1/7308/Mv19123-RA.1
MGNVQAVFDETNQLSGEDQQLLWEYLLDGSIDISDACTAKFDKFKTMLDTESPTEPSVILRRYHTLSRYLMAEGLSPHHRQDMLKARARVAKRVPSSLGVDMDKLFLLEDEKVVKAVTLDREQRLGREAEKAAVAFRAQRAREYEERKKREKEAAKKADREEREAKRLKKLNTHDIRKFFDRT